MNAVPPVMESDDENVFVGWDTDKYLSVTEDIVVTAKYIPADEMPTLKSARDSYYMYPGNTRILSALTSNIDKETETIIWTSMNPKIATVTDDGRLEAVSEGETDIVISELSSGLMAICTVNVAADPSSVIDDNPPTTTTENNPSSTTTTTTVTPDPTTTDTHIASDEELCEWAENDYQNKNGLTFTNSFVKEAENGDYQIMITDKSGKVLDTYTIDPETGKGFNSEGEEVDLPQTGNNSLRKLLIIISSLMLIGIGMVAIYASSIIRRKKNEE